MNIATREIIIPKLRDYFATQPIAKAWLFGSYSRGEEKDGSDVDILVAFDKDAKLVSSAFKNKKIEGYRFFRRTKKSKAIVCDMCPQK